MIIPLLLLPLMATSLTAQVRYGAQTAWPYPMDVSGSATTALNTAVIGGYSGTWYAWMVVPSATKQVSKVHQNIGSVTGSLGANDFCAAVWSDSSTSAPNAEIENRCTLDSAIGAGMVAVNGFTATSTLTAGTPYWIVFRNANATPTSNSPSLSNFQPVTGLAFGINSTATVTSSAFAKSLTSTDGGSTWASATRVSCTLVEYTDGTFEGFPCRAVSVTGAFAHANRMQGTQFVPARPLTVSGACGFVARLGTVSADATFRIYAGGGASSRTLVAETMGLPVGKLGTAATTNCRMFSAPVTLSAGNTYSLVFYLNSGDASNRIQYAQVTTQAMGTRLEFPQATGVATVLSTDNGGTWSNPLPNGLTVLWLLVNSTLNVPPGGFAQ